MTRPTSAGIALAALLFAACSYASVYESVTSEAEVGVPAEQIVASDCGLDGMAFDHDGSMWVATAISDSERSGTPPGFTPENDVGTIVLLSEDEAAYTSSQGRVVPLTRLPGELRIDGC